jgi:hypothetical protein
MKRLQYAIIIVGISFRFVLRHEEGLLSTRIFVIKIVHNMKKEKR